MTLARFVKKTLAATLAVSMAGGYMPPEAWAEDDMVGEIGIVYADDFAGQTVYEAVHIKDERTGKFTRLRFRDNVRPAFEPGERVRVREFRRLSSKEIELPDRSPLSIMSLGGAGTSGQTRTEVVAKEMPSLPSGTLSTQNVPVGAAPVPVYHSRPSAAAKLFLDFDGHFEAYWGTWSNVTTPPYDTDGDPSTFSAGELANIQEIWSRVAENFALFNIDVTTEDPGNQDNRKTAVIAIGGSASDWYGSSAGGLAYWAGFWSGSPNVGYVFENNLGNGVPQYCSTAAGHEAGHLFGLSHQTKWDGTTLVESYSTGEGNWAPIMGVGYYDPQDIWHNGPTGCPTNCFQDDLAIISGTNNAFGYAADEYGDTNATAFSLPGVSYSQGGTIQRNEDSDRFRLNFSQPGTLAVSATVPAFQPMLDAVVNLYDAGGAVVASGAPTNSFSAGLNLSLGAGTYYLEVKSTGVYGHIGNYEVTGSFTASGSDTTPPTIANVAVTNVTATGATVTWATNENADTQAEYGLTASYGNTTAVDATLVLSHSRTLGGLAPGTLYHLRVRSRDGSGNLSVSGDVTFTTAASDTTPPTISNVAVSNITHNSAAISWNTNEGATTRVEYGLTTSYGNATTNDPSIVTTHGQSLAGLNPGTLYHYRVVSADASGNQAFSGDFTFNTNAAPPPNTRPVAQSQSLTTAFATPKSITLIASDPNGQPLTYRVTSQPAGGILSGAAPALTYTPNPGFSGADSFAFVANDGVIDSLPATVSMTVLPPDAAAAGGRSVTVVRNVIDPSKGQSAEVELSVSAGTSVKIHVFDRAGNLVREFNQDVAPGAALVKWDGRNGAGEDVASGAYYLRMNFDSRTVSATVAVIK